jgi:hypothetical protein
VSRTDSSSTYKQIRLHHRPFGSGRTDRQRHVDASSREVATLNLDVSRAQTLGREPPDKSANHSVLTRRVPTQLAKRR